MHRVCRALRKAAPWALFGTMVLVYLYGWAVLFRRGSGSLFAHGWDFHFAYTSANMVLGGEGRSLYDLGVQARWQQALLPPDLVGTGGRLRFNNPAFFLLPYLPFVLLPLEVAYWVGFSLNSLLLVGLCVWLGYRAGLRREQLGQAVLGGLAFLPAFICLIQGQLSILVTLFLSLAYVDLVRGRNFRAGVWLALGAVKFQLIPGLLLVFLLKTRWKAMLGLLVTAVLLLALFIGMAGVDGLSDYVQQTAGFVVGSQSLTETSGYTPRVMQNWKALLMNLLGSTPTTRWLSLALLLLAIGALVWAWRGEWLPGTLYFDLQIALTVLLTVLATPYLYLHDLSVLLFPGLVLAGRAVTSSSRTVRALIPVVVAVPPLSLLFMLGEGLPNLGVILMTLAVVGLAGWLARLSPQDCISSPPGGILRSSMGGLSGWWKGGRFR